MRARRQRRGGLRAGAVAATLSALSALGPLAPSASGTTCSSAPWNELEVAHEIIDIGTVYTRPQAALPTYKGAGENPVSDDVWNGGYAPPSPYIANTTRNLQFNESQFIASPGEPVCTTGYVTTSDGYTWAAMSLAINAMWPYRPGSYTGLPSRNAYYAGNLVETPPPGVVKVTANFKGQNMKFWANQSGVAPGTPGAVPLTRYFVRDRWGNVYVMHASGRDTPEEVDQAFDEAVLPKGWKKYRRTLTRDLVLNPAEGSDGSFHYLVIRDSADSTYHQLKWSDRGSLQAPVQGAAMPIWGGQDGNVLRGTRRADLIHAAGGNDKILPGRGADEVWGDAGFDTVVLPGAAGAFRLLKLKAGRGKLVIAGLGSRKVIRDVERLRFKDGIVRVGALRGRDLGKRLQPDKSG